MRYSPASSTWSRSGLMAGHAGEPSGGRRSPKTAIDTLPGGTRPDERRNHGVSFGTFARNGSATRSGASSGLPVADHERKEMAMPDTCEERIGTVDVWRLHRFKAPIQRTFA